jgi:large subunit ribosomal protein LX
MAKIVRIKGEIVGKDEPMVFTKEYNVVKENDALETMYSEISVEEIQSPILKKTLEMN